MRTPFSRPPCSDCGAEALCHVLARWKDDALFPPAFFTFPHENHFSPSLPLPASPLVRSSPCSLLGDVTSPFQAGLGENIKKLFTFVDETIKNIKNPFTFVDEQ